MSLGLYEPRRGSTKRGFGYHGAMPSSRRPVRTALCLCAGGITGAMYEVGALAALDDFFAAQVEERPRFSVNDFDLYVGTSAGSFVATLISAGVRARRLFRAILEDDP